MNASKDSQSDAGASRARGFLGLRLGAAILTVASGLLAQSAPAQTLPAISMEMNMGPTMTLPTVTVPTVTVPDPFAAVEQALPCADGSMSCMNDLLKMAGPALEPLPSPPTPTGPTQPEPPDSSQPKGDSPAPGAAGTDRADRTPRKRAPALETPTLASRPALAALVASPPQVADPEPRRPRPAPALPAPRSVDPQGLPAASLLPSALSAFEWGPLLFNLLLAAGSLALLLFVLAATPRHGVGHVSYWVADRRYDLGLLGAVLLFGLAVGYFIATSVG